MAKESTYLEDSKGKQTNNIKDAEYLLTKSDEMNSIRRFKILPREERITSDTATTFELAHIAGTRASHLNSVDPLIVVTDQTTNEEISLAELVQKKIPFAIMRVITNPYLYKGIMQPGLVEIIPLSEFRFNKNFILKKEI